MMIFEINQCAIFQVLGYYKSGADSETTVADNREAFTRMRLLPRMLVDVSNLDTTVSIQGD